MVAFEVILNNGDRAEAETEGGILLAARTLVSDASAHGAATKMLRADVIVTRDGVYDTALTQRARAGQS